MIKGRTARGGNAGGTLWRKMGDVRHADIAENLTRVRSRIADACAAAGRPVTDVTLIAVTKTYPASDVLHLASLGVRDVGENRDQEAAPKAAEVGAVGLRWHYVGQLQRNKCRSVAGYADMVQSVDRLALVSALANARADRAAVPLDVLVQVDLDRTHREAHRGGAAPDDIAAIADGIAAAPSLRLAGVMAVAPLGLDAGGLDRAFERLAVVSADLRRAYPEATVISAGMSADLESAIFHGATHVRVGSALLGTRPPLG